MLFFTNRILLNQHIFMEPCTSHVSFKVSVHVSDSSDEEEDEEFLQVELRNNDVESGNSVREKQTDRSKPLLDEIVPIYRRDCHEEVCFFSYDLKKRKG